MKRSINGMAKFCEFFDGKREFLGSLLLALIAEARIGGRSLVMQKWQFEGHEGFHLHLRSQLLRLHLNRFILPKYPCTAGWSVGG